ncbi:receptor-type tyrosine-protein phosphatase T-like isoform X1 [Mya arenaria]|uniref:receptor-type tyrosine-protein phosphatase T-like isoform X1 n=1 Tax=Mya arenaria TaxID=6604 RepID=UPI0022E4776E|nr:receptor-type tyrosine-protein phosphatase T-like isoform X1 [Mya arenaria]
MGDYRHVGFIFVFVYLNRFYFPQSLACNVEINDFHRFGPTCEHLCHCVGNKMCNDTTGVCDECEDPWFGPACQYYDIAFQFIDKKKAYGSRHLDNIKPHKYADLAQDGNFSTCSSTNISSAGNRAIPPFWSIYFINNTRFNDIQLVLSENETLRAYFNGYKIYIENLTSWGYQIKDRNYLPPNTSRSLCYQHNGSQITDRTMVVQCGKTLIGNSVRIEMANKDTQLVLCDIKISAGRNMAFGKGLTPSPNNIQSSYSSTGSFDGNTDTICSGMYGHDSQPEWIQVDLMHQVELNLIVITGYQTDGFPDSGFKIEVYNNSTSFFEEVFDNSTDVRLMAEIVLTSQGQYFKIRSLAGKQHFAVCEIQMFGYCLENYCGYDCSFPCHCRVPGSMKDRLTGVCTSGCAGRSTGRNGLCNYVCNKTTWGEECKKKCGHCINGDSCNVSNGHCTACASGYKPTTTCEDECDPGMYGFNCFQKCGQCRLALDCDKVSGMCSEGCDAGWNGTRCDQACENGTYGSNCLETCGNCVAECVKETGTCLGGCLSGFTGDTCKDIASSSGSVIGGSVVVVIVIAVGIVISVIFIRRRKAKPIKRRKAKSPYANGTEDDQSGMNMDGENIVYINTDAVQQTSTAHDICEATVIASAAFNVTECDEPTVYYNTEAFQRKASYHSINPIAVSELEGYLKVHYNDIDFFEKRFQKIPSGLQFPTTAAKRSENIGKNRYKGLYAYDHSRVVIQTEMSYINACFIKGFQKTISYVASQGPMESNMEDFWQMIWEQNIQTVVMVTNLVEETKMKCLQYWGEGLKHQTTYGNFEVTLMKEEVFADFCIRTVGFHRTIHPSERRKLTQFHYTSWPDKDVPQSPISLIHFWRKVKLRGGQRKHPWLVHCSAGIGRTGTFIAMDFLYDQGTATEVVDIAQCVTDLREDRVNMVQTVGQYRLLHRLMLELFVLPFEPVRNELFDNTFREMSRVAHKSKSRKSRLRLQYEDLDKGLEMDSVDDDIACTTALLPDNYSKNRFDHILSADEYRPFLRSQCQGRNNYINAVFMPSYTNPKGFIISQMPLPSTAVDVCRLIIDEEINLVVQFDDSGKEEIGRFLPENEEKMKIDAFEVRRVRTYSGQDCQIQTVCLKLNHRTRTFKHILFKKWTRNRLVPPDSSSLLNLVKEVEGQQSPEDNWDSPILVLCLNGAERSGLFVVLMNIMERCRVEGEVSIPQVIRYLRSRRKQIVPNLEQYVYCHNVTAKYLESSMTYANLQSAGSDA